MLRSVIAFELKYHFARVSTWIYFAGCFGVGLLIMTTLQPTGKLYWNAPTSLAQYTAAIAGFGIIINAAICGMAVCRDFEKDTYPLFFTTRLSRSTYLSGRLIGSLIIAAFVFSGPTLGLLVGSVFRASDAAHMLPINLWAYVQPYLLFTLTSVWFTGALFFAIGALTRRSALVFLQAVIFLAAYTSVEQLFALSRDAYLISLVDPFGLMPLSHVTRYWTIVETNSLLAPFEGVLFWNRMLWSALGAIAVAVTFRLFPHSAEATRSKKGRDIAVRSPAIATARLAALIRVKTRFDRAAALRQFLSLTGVRVRVIVTDITFICIAVLTIALQLTLGWSQPRIADTPVFPVTYLMTDNVGLLFAVVITAIYAGELVWKERALRYDQIHDALPMPSWLNFASQFSALTLVQITVLATITLGGLIIQASQGYYRFEMQVYISELFVFELSALMMYSVLALCIQTLVPAKFLGHALVIGVFLAPDIILAPLASKLKFSFPSMLYSYGERPDVIYSAMNGYGFGLRPLFWFTLYWTLVAGLVAIAALLFARRGTDRGVRERWRRARVQLTRPMLATTFAIAAFAAATGGFIYWNVRVLNEFTSVDEYRARAASYEKNFKQYEWLPQPRIVDVELHVDLSPSNGLHQTRGVYLLQNRTKSAISAIHIAGDEDLRNVELSRSFTRIFNDTVHHYSILELAAPLQPQDTVRMSFEVANKYPGFSDGGEPTSIVANGTFLSGTPFLIGYDRGGEIGDEEVRKQYGLPPREEMPLPSDSLGRLRNFFVPDADWITFRATISTDPDQIAVAPGYLTREWTENGRRYFRYDMGSATMHKFFSVLSARYAVTRDIWNGVNIEVFHDPQHPHNVDNMIDATKAGLDYFSKAFGPYQFRQFRILEFPRYSSFAQSFPNTVPYSESVGFIANPTTEDDVDLAFAVTAHELAHQWFGHQVVGAFAKGSNVLSESLAQYASALLVEHRFGAAQMRIFLKRQLDAYLTGRSGETRAEATLARVTRSPYIWYNKGAMALYALKDYMGEERLNGAIRGFLDRVKFQSAPYTTIDEFIAVLREAAPDSVKYLVTDLFETITLYDNRATEAGWRRTPEGRYLVSVRVHAEKLRADNEGRETSVAINDLVDIGVFSGKGPQEKVLYLRKHRVTQREETIEILVDEIPERVGIDPYHKLIDRDSDDNIVGITREKQ